VIGRSAIAAAAVALAAVGACSSARADDPGYELRVTDDVTIELGSSTAISVAIVPAAGRTVSGDGPVRVGVTGPDALGLPRRRYGRKDAADPAADAPRFDIKVKARDAGDHRLTLDVRFWLCGARVCLPIATSRTVTVHVPAPVPIDAALPVDAAVDAAPAVDAGRRRR
jgi:hypothetical protein